MDVKSKKGDKRPKQMEGMERRRREEKPAFGKVLAL